MPQSIHVTQLWAVGQIVQTIDNLNPNSKGFDLRFSYPAGSKPPGPLVTIQIETAIDGVNFTVLFPTRTFGPEQNKDGTPSTGFGVSGEWGWTSPDGGQTKNTVRGAAVRGTIGVLQPFTASLDVVTT